ncbi:hypothetical protein [Streptacidiphilus carbonis]|jgi:hypothetical protein|uniref:hypothetical protein n=1 Tax=Streptacidiphilus carbonis TaxID=105422 RepID=UPI0005A84DB3|nr:hypothetical protein [Streptacidiphilus carbonis]
MPSVTMRRKRPVTVRTLLWTGVNQEEMREFCGGAFRVVDPTRPNRDAKITAEVFDELHSTWIGVYTGHHVVRGVRGEYYPIDEAALNETYEPTGPDM